MCIKLNKVSLLVLLLLISVAPLSGSQTTKQEYPTGIYGRVTTEDGGLFPGAEIRIINKSTKQSRIIPTNGDGEYSIDLPPGTYEVNVSAPSWKPAKRKPIKVESHIRYVVDFVLQPGKPVITDAEHP